MKKIFITLGIVVLIIVGYIVFKPNSPVVKDSIVNKSFLDFVNSKGSFECQVTQDIEGTASNGVVFLSDGKIREDFLTEIQGNKINSSMVVKDGYTYTWTSMMPNIVYKVKISDQNVSDQTVKTSGTYSFDAKQIGSYDCKDWIPNESKFQVPEGAKIMDLETPNPSVPTTNPTQPTTNNTTPTSEKTFTLAEIATHNNKTSCYTTINSNVYDVTSYIPRHPGGESKILKICGKDGSSLFEDQHGGQMKPEKILETFYIGKLAN